MTYSKALKTLERKKNGFIVPISVMESPVYSADDFIKEYFNKVHPIAIVVINGSHPLTSFFKLQPMGKPIQYAAVNIDIMSNKKLQVIYREDYPGEWQWYSFSQLFNKLGCIKLDFGLDNKNRVIRSPTEKNIDLYCMDFKINY